MSSSSNRNMSAKEREILERQRALAARFKPPPPAAGPPAAAGSAVSNRGGSFQPVATPKAQPPSTASKFKQEQLPSRKQPPAPGRAVPSSSRPIVSAAAATAPVASSASSRRGSSSSSSDVVVDLSRDNNMKPPSAAATKRPQPPPSAPPQKRPAKKRALGAASTSQALLAAARSRALSTSTPVANTTTATATGSHPTNKLSAKLKRKSLTQESGTASLAKLVQHVSASAAAANGSNAWDDADNAASIPTVQPDDFWKHLRDWDLVSQYANEMKEQQQQSRGTAAASDNEASSSAMVSSSSNTAKKTLPNVFMNSRHYIAAWAPLCLAECRAQILQQATTTASGNNNNNTFFNPIAVTTESTTSRARHRGSFDHNDAPWMPENETGGHVLVRPKPGQQQQAAAADLSFTSGDLCLLLHPHYATVLQDISRGVAHPPAGKDDDDPHAFRSVALIGHAETTRNDWTRGGLVLKVSKHKWAVIGQTDMLLVKLGSNITALREFTALCRVDTLPLKRYLLGLHLNSPDEQHRRKLSSRQSTEQLLGVLGGSQSLGQGFVDYCRQKFNASQLTAIAASAHAYGEGGFTLIKGPPGTGKTTTLVAILNSLHIRQFNKYYQEVRRIAAKTGSQRRVGLELASKAKPRLLVCAPSNAAVDNIILKIMQDGFVDGQGKRYNPSIIRVGVGQSDAVRAVSLSAKVDSMLTDVDHGRLDTSEAGFRLELSRLTQDIANVRRRLHAIQSATPYPLSRDWEIRIDEDSFDETSRVYFVNHKEQVTTYELPPPPEPGETHFPSTSMPEYRAYMSRTVKLVENYFSIKSHLDRCTIIKHAMDNGIDHVHLRQDLETLALNSAHIVMTTLGTAGNRTLDGADKFEVVVVDEAAQSVEPAILSALQLGNRHAVLVGDPQQLPATIFNVSGRNSKYDRSLFQRLEEAGQPVYMLNEQYRMHPSISHFPRHIFYGGALLDGPNVREKEYGNPLRGILCRSVPTFQPFTILDLDSMEERGGTSLSNTAEARLAVHLFEQLKLVTRGLSSTSRVAVITPYAQQSKLLRRMFENALGPSYGNSVEVNTVDAFQGREANIVIFSAVRAAGSHGVGFLADVRRMNVALTRAKHFLFVICRCESIVVNPYWNDLVQHARETKAVVRVPMRTVPNNNNHAGPSSNSFGDLASWPLEQSCTMQPLPPYKDTRMQTNAS